MAADSPPSGALRLAAVPLMLGAGAQVAVQSQINGRLAQEIGTGMRAGVLAAVISLGTGLVALVLATALMPRLRRQYGLFVATVRNRRLLPAELVGGMFGVLLVASQGLAVGTIGVALFSVAVTAGQSEHERVARRPPGLRSRRPPAAEHPACSGGTVRDRGGRHRDGGAFLRRLLGRRRRAGSARAGRRRPAPRSSKP